MENTLSPSGVNEHLQSRHSPGTSHERNDFFSLSHPPTGSQGRGSLCPWRWWQPAPGGLRERERERENSPVPLRRPQNSPADSCPGSATVLWPRLALWAPAMPHARALTSAWLVSPGRPHRGGCRSEGLGQRGSRLAGLPSPSQAL